MTTYYQVMSIHYQGQQIVSCGNDNAIYRSFDEADTEAREKFERKRRDFGTSGVTATHDESGHYQICTTLGTEFNWRVQEANLQDRHKNERNAKMKQPNYKIGDRVREVKGQRLTGTVSRIWRDIHGWVFRVAFEIGGYPCGGEYYERDLEVAK